MGAAYDRDGNMLGETYGETKREVFDKLTAEFKDAHEIRIKTVEQMTNEGSIGTGPDRNIAQRQRPPLSERISLDNIEQAFTYQRWTDEQTEHGRAVTAALIAAGKTILQNVPECPTRTRAINNLIDARMLANAAITHDGRF